jgi:hypothetical protein
MDDETVNLNKKEKRKTEYYCKYCCLRELGYYCNQTRLTSHSRWDVYVNPLYQSLVHYNLPLSCWSISLWYVSIHVLAAHQEERTWVGAIWRIWLSHAKAGGNSRIIEPQSSSVTAIVEDANGRVVDKQEKYFTNGSKLQREYQT